MTAPDTVLLVLTNCPGHEMALQIGQQLVERQLAACANVLAGCHSIYHWQGKVESAEETPLLLKTPARCYPALEAALRELHPYEVPEIIAVPLAAGLPAYLDWVAASCPA